MVLTQLLLAVAACTYAVSANMAPNYPEPGTIWKAGQEYEITWFDDKKGTHIDKGWTKFKIDFMTGDNNNQKFIKNIARDLDASKIKSLKWTAPEVEPHAAVYFLMFTNDKKQVAWTTRFGITGEDGKLEKPEHSVQPDGAKIPWGVGKLAGNSDNPTPSSSSNATYSLTPAMSTALEQNAAVVIAVSSGASAADRVHYTAAGVTVLVASFLVALFI